MGQTVIILESKPKHFSPEQMMCDSVPNLIPMLTEMSLDERLDSPSAGNFSITDCYHYMLAFYLPTKRR